MVARTMRVRSSTTAPGLESQPLVGVLVTKSEPIDHGCAQLGAGELAAF